WGEPFRVAENRSYDEREHPPLYERWTATARLTVVTHALQAWGWGFGSRFTGARVDEMFINQDGSAGTPMDRFDGDPASADWLRYDVTTAGEQLRAPHDVCIIGGGGGRDIIAAKLFGATHVDAVELHPET